MYDSSMYPQPGRRQEAGDRMKTDLYSEFRILCSAETRRKMSNVAVVKTFSLVVAVIGLMAGCAGERTPRPMPPAWVSEKPHLPSLYQGVGASEESWGQADERALADLAAELRVTVWSVIRDMARETVTDGGSEVEESVFSETQTMVDETLEGARIVERWRGPSTGEYWAYAVLEKAEVQRRVEREIEDARRMALDHYASASLARERHEMALALKYYVDAFAALRTVIGRPVEADLDGDGAPEVLSSEIDREIGRVLMGMELVPRNDRLTAKAGRPMEAPLVVQAVYSSSGGRIALSGVPVRFAFLRGTGQLDARVTTGPDGLAQCRVYEIGSGGTECEIEARLDLRALIVSDSTSDATIRAISDRLEAHPAPSARFGISVEPRRAMVRIEERNLGSIASPSFIGEALVRKLLEAGFVVVPEEETRTAIGADDVAGVLRNGDLSAAGRAGARTRSDVVIVGEAHTEYSQTQFGLISCWASAAVRGMDVERLEIVASADVHRVKGFDDDRKEQAGERALEKAASLVVDRIMEQLLVPR